jgi:uncharacterized membrane protein YjfL (UPF0719 family)
MNIFAIAPYIGLAIFAGMVFYFVYTEIQRYRNTKCLKAGRKSQIYRIDTGMGKWQ